MANGVKLAVSNIGGVPVRNGRFQKSKRKASRSKFSSGFLLNNQNRTPVQPLPPQGQASLARLAIQNVRGAPVTAQPQRAMLPRPPQIAPSAQMDPALSHLALSGGAPLRSPQFQTGGAQPITDQGRTFDPRFDGENSQFFTAINRPEDPLGERNLQFATGPALDFASPLPQSPDALSRAPGFFANTDFPTPGLPPSREQLLAEALAAANANSQGQAQPGQTNFGDATGFGTPGNPGPSRPPGQTGFGSATGLGTPGQTGFGSSSSGLTFSPFSRPQASPSGGFTGSIITNPGQSQQGLSSGGQATPTLAGSQPGQVSQGIEPATAAVIGGGVLLGGLLQNRAANQQAQAASQISREQLEEINRQRGLAIGDLRLGADFTERGLTDVHNRLLGIQQRDFGGTISPFLTGQRRAGEELLRGRDQTLGELGRAGNLAGGQLGQLAQTGLSFLPGATQSVGARNLLGVPGVTSDVGQRDVTQGQGAARGSTDLFGGIESDPGFQFELEQGQRALGAAASARGGRSGGRAAKELLRFSQGLAASRAQDVFNRRATAAGLEQQELGRLAGLSTAQAGTEQQERNRLANLLSQQAGLETQAGLAAQANQGRFAGMGLGALADRAELLASLGQTRAGVVGQTGTSLADLASRTGATHADLLAGDLSRRLGITERFGGDLARLPLGVSETVSQIRTGGPLQGSLQALSLPAQTAGLGSSAAAQTVNNLTQLGLLAAMSNPGGQRGFDFSPSPFVPGPAPGGGFRI